MSKLFDLDEPITLSKGDFVALFGPNGHLESMVRKAIEDRLAKMLAEELPGVVENLLGEVSVREHHYKNIVSGFDAFAKENPDLAGTPGFQDLVLSRYADQGADSPYFADGGFLKLALDLKAELTGAGVPEAKAEQIAVEAAGDAAEAKGDEDGGNDLGPVGKKVLASISGREKPKAPRQIGKSGGKVSGAIADALRKAKG